MKNFFIVNGLLFLGAVAIPNYSCTMGSTASSHVDPRTKQPVLLELRGCRMVNSVNSVNSDADTGKPPPPPPPHATRP